MKLVSPIISTGLGPEYLDVCQWNTHKSSHKLQFIATYPKLLSHSKHLSRKKKKKKKKTEKKRISYTFIFYSVH